MRPGGGRKKGHDFEREVVRDMKNIFGEDKAWRGLQSRGGGKEEADVVCPMFHVECKRGKKPNVRAALEQAVRDEHASFMGARSPMKYPVAVVRDDRKPAFVCMQYEDWLLLVWDAVHGEGNDS